MKRYENEGSWIDDEITCHDKHNNLLSLFSDTKKEDKREE
jgi:hypothetical protein